MEIFDTKVIDTVNELAEEAKRLSRNAKLPFHPLAFFAETVAMTRQESTGVSIEDIAKCFKAQFDEAELKSLVKELTQLK